MTDAQIRNNIGLVAEAAKRLGTAGMDSLEERICQALHREADFNPTLVPEWVKEYVGFKS